MICFTGYLRAQSSVAKDTAAEEFKLTGGKGIRKCGAEICFISYLFGTILVSFTNVSKSYGSLKFSLRNLFKSTET